MTQCGKQTRKLALRNHCGPKITILAFEFLVSKSPLNVFKCDYYIKIDEFRVESKIYKNKFDFLNIFYCPTVQPELSVEHQIP